MKEIKISKDIMRTNLFVSYIANEYEKWLRTDLAGILIEIYCNLGNDEFSIYETNRDK